MGAIRITGTATHCDCSIFFWPAVQALYQSVLLQDAFGLSTEFVWFENFKILFEDPAYLTSFKTTGLFSALVAVTGLAVSLILAVFADRVVRGAAVYKTLLIWPYSVSPVVVGVLWMFLLNPTLGVVAHLLRHVGIEWNHLLNAQHAMILIVLAAVWKQVSYNF